MVTRNRLENNQRAFVRLFAKSVHQAISPAVTRHFGKGASSPLLRAIVSFHQLRTLSVRRRRGSYAGAPINTAAGPVVPMMTTRQETLMECDGERIRKVEPQGDAE